jgi:hypothetical protein
MSSIRVSGNTSGHYDLTVPDVAGSNTIALDKIVVADSNGYVGIGTTTAYSASTDFEVKATDPKIVINNTGQRAYGLLVSGTKLYIRDESDDQDIVTITEGGRVGIGTDTPATTLNVKSSSYPYVRVTNDGYTGLDIGQADSSEGGAGLIKLRDAADMDFYTADLNRMRISSTGNIGIGTLTTDPVYKLQVDHGTGSEYASSIRNTNDNLQLLLGTTSGGLLNIQGKTISSNAVYDIALQAEGGDVGIGTASPDEKLDVRGHIKMTNSYLKVRRSATYDQAWDIGITHASASQHGSLFIYPPSSQTVQSTSGVVIGTGNTASNYPFILNGDGILSLDHQPSANVYVNGGNAGAYNNTATNSVIVAAGIRHNIGSHYNSSNGRFTCPISGRYFVSFSANWYNNSAGTWIRPQIKKNGATVTQHYENTASNPVWMHIGASTIIDCSQGDYLEIYNQTQSGAGGGMDTGAYSNINFHKIA